MFDDRYVGDGKSPEVDRQICPECGEEVELPEIGHHDRCIERRWTLEDRD